jgi:AcrR family transcriptional regulator
MARHKKYTREHVLEKVTPLFWAAGFSGTGMRAIEVESGVNKSGLYAEFADKDDIFVACLAFYYATQSPTHLLASEPLGWDNVERFLAAACKCTDRVQGCFAISASRDFQALPSAAQALLVEGAGTLRALFATNLAAAGAPEDFADLVSTFFSGLCLEQNLARGPAQTLASVRQFIAMLKAANTARV